MKSLKEIHSEYSYLGAKARWNSITQEESQRLSELGKLVWGARKRPACDRFWEKVAVGNTDSCWPWKASVCPKGYGKFVGDNGEHTKAHRFAFTIAHGPIPEGQCVCHRCDNPPCCNPTHLFAGTTGDNTRDSVRKGRFVSTKRGETHFRARWTENDVLKMRSLRTSGMSISGIAKIMNCSNSRVCEIVHRKTWKHI